MFVYDFDAIIIMKNSIPQLNSQISTTLAEMLIDPDGK
jgi:hypothetical protein